MKEMNSLIESIKMIENLTEEGIAVKMGYNSGYISQVRSRGSVSVKFVEALKREFKDGLQIANTARNKLVHGGFNPEDGTTRHILLVLAEAFKSQTEILKNIESKMARADALATMDTNLTRTLAVAEKIAIVQDRSHIELLDHLAKLLSGKNVPFEGEGSKSGRSDADGRKRGKSPA